jgi:hypothetical protein
MVDVDVTGVGRNKLPGGEMSQLRLFQAGHTLEDASQLDGEWSGIEGVFVRSIAKRWLGSSGGWTDAPPALILLLLAGGWQGPCWYFWGCDMAIGKMGGAYAQ